MKFPGRNQSRSPCTSGSEEKSTTVVLSSHVCRGLARSTFFLTIFPEGTRDGSLHIVGCSGKSERLRHLRSFAFPNPAKLGAQCHPWLVACSFWTEASSPADASAWILASFRGEAAAWKIDFDAQLTRGEDQCPVSLLNYHLFPKVL